MILLEKGLQWLFLLSVGVSTHHSRGREESWHYNLRESASVSTITRHKPLTSSPRAYMYVCIRILLVHANEDDDNKREYP